MSARIAVTYNESVGGASVLSLQQTLKEIGTEVINADYRKIVPANNNIEAIYSDKKLLEETYLQAKKNASSFLKDKDCLMLSGNSSMIDSRLYGGNTKNGTIDLERSIAEMALIHVAMQKGMPVLGICGGHQILNVYLGGNIQSLNKQQLASQKMLDYSKVKIEPQSELAAMMHKNKPTNKQVVERLFGAHLQVVNELGGKNSINKNQDYLKVTAHATDRQKNIEAMESQFGAPVMGLQFHPEVAVKGLPNNGYIYQAERNKDIVKNKNIFLAFKQSAEAYKAKKNMIAQIHDLGIVESLKSAVQSVKPSAEKILQQERKIIEKLEFKPTEKDLVEFMNAQKSELKNELAQIENLKTAQEALGNTAKGHYKSKAANIQKNSNANQQNAGHTDETDPLKKRREHFIKRIVKKLVKKIVAKFVMPKHSLSIQTGEFKKPISHAETFKNLESGVGNQESNGNSHNTQKKAKHVTSTVPRPVSYRASRRSSTVVDTATRAR